MRLPEQKGLRSVPVARDVQACPRIGSQKCLLVETGVSRIVFHQQYFRLWPHEWAFEWSRGARSENEKTEPWPSLEATQIRPPCRSTTFLQRARPMPVPG